MKVVVHNGAGGRTVRDRSTDERVFGYHEADGIGAWLALLQRFEDVDFFLLQETLIPYDRQQSSMAAQLATAMGYVCWEESAGHPATHIDPSCELGMAILSRQPLRDQTIIPFPKPIFALRWEDGTLAPDHHKFIMSAITKEDVQLFNGHMLPMHRWKFDYREEPARTLAQEIEKVLLGHLRSGPLVFGVDMNTEFPEIVYPLLFEQLRLSSALPAGIPTEHKGRRFDYLFYSPDFCLGEHPPVIISDCPFDHFPISAEFVRK